MLILIRYILPWKLCTNVDLEKGTISKGNFIFHSHLFSGDTPPKFNIAPENRPSQKETHLPTIHFQGLSSTSRGYVSFQGGYCIFFRKNPSIFPGRLLRMGAPTKANNQKMKSQMESKIRLPSLQKSNHIKSRNINH